MVDIAVLSGSLSDQAIVDRIVRKLDERGVSFEHRVLSAHRNPKELDEFVSATDARVFIAVAGLSAASTPCVWGTMAPISMTKPVKANFFAVLPRTPAPSARFPHARAAAKRSPGAGKVHGAPVRG